MLESRTSAPAGFAPQGRPRRGGSFARARTSAPAGRRSRSIEDSQPNKLCYSHDTFGGQSGSPIYLSNNTVIGIHTNGVSRFGLCPKRNAGTRITQGLFSVILNIAR